MDTSVVRAIVEAHLVDLKTYMGLNPWKITVSYGPTDMDDTVATCERKAEYLRAYIVIDPHLHETPEDVFDSLVHELLHVVLSPFDLYMQTMASLVEDKPELARLETIQFQHAVEAVLGNVELMLRHGTSFYERFQSPDEDEDEETLIELVPAARRGGRRVA